jgi:hypothetical protein
MSSNDHSRQPQFTLQRMTAVVTVMSGVFLLLAHVAHTLGPAAVITQTLFSASILIILLSIAITKQPSYPLLVLPVVVSCATCAYQEFLIYILRAEREALVTLWLALYISLLPCHLCLATIYALQHEGTAAFLNVSCGVVLVIYNVFAGGLSRGLSGALLPP